MTTMQVLIGFKTTDDPVDPPNENALQYVTVRESGHWYSGFQLSEGHGIYSFPHSRTHWMLQKLVQLTREDPSLSKDDIGVHILNPAPSEHQA